MTSGSQKTGLLDELRIDRSEHEHETQGHLGRWLAAIGTVVACATAGFFLWARGETIEVSGTTAVSAATDAAPAAILQATGYVTAEREATVSSQIPGQLSHVYFDEGQHVRRGQVLARLDDSAERAALDQAKVQLAAALAQLSQYQVQLAQDQRDFARDAALIGQHLVSEEDFETARTLAVTTAAQVKTQQRQVESAQVGVQAAQVQENYTVVEAPFSGVVIAKAAQVGDFISPIFGGGSFEAAGVAAIVDMSSLEVDVDVNEAYIHRVTSGQLAVAVLDAYPNWNIPAHVIAIVPTADKSKATVKVRVAFQKLDPRILPDMGVRVSFLSETSSAQNRGAPATMRGVLVPPSSIVQRHGRSVVFVIEDDHARKQSVSPGAVHGDRRIVGGLPAGTEIVTAPPPQLRDGSRITVESETSS